MLPVSLAQHEDKHVAAVEQDHRDTLACNIPTDESSVRFVYAAFCSNAVTAVAGLWCVSVC